MVPDPYLNPSLWRQMNIGALYTIDPDGTVHPGDSKSAASVYRPASLIPTFVLCRISESTKRLDNGLTLDEVASGAWGKLHLVMGSGSTIGALMSVSSEVFGSCHRTPDGVHLVRPLDASSLVAPVTKPLFSFKTFRSFRIGPADDDAAPHDLMLTAKKRWFRKRNNPKFLGFSKDDKL